MAKNKFTLEKFQYIENIAYVTTPKFSVNIMVNYIFCIFVKLKWQSASVLPQINSSWLLSYHIIKDICRHVLNIEFYKIT